MKMKTNSSFNFTEIINDIKSGKIESLYIVTYERYEDDEYEPELIETEEIYYAGITVDEARACINAVEADTHPAEYESVTLAALELSVSAEDFEDFDEECDNAMEFFGNYVDEHFVEGSNVGTSDWNVREVNYDYKPLQNGILIYWEWCQHVGYARKLKRLEYCLDNANALRCKPIDKVSAVQCSLLVSPSEVHECKAASELRDLIQKRYDGMKLWNNDCNVDEFLRNMYKDADICQWAYKLPENDIYRDGE